MEFIEDLKAFAQELIKLLKFCKNFFLELTIIEKVGYTITFGLYSLLLFQWVVLGSVGIAIITTEFVDTVYRIGLIIAVLSRDLRLILIHVIGMYAVVTLSIFLGEFIGYFVEFIFGIDLYPR